MRIGIDIDNTLTEIEEELMEKAEGYARQLGKNINVDREFMIDTTNDGNIYQKMFGFNEEELKHFLGPIQESITSTAIPRENAVEILNQLHLDGHSIYIITARDSQFHKNPYEQSKEWLKGHYIYFDQLIVNARNKGKVCAEYEIDLLIDDNARNCIEADQYGIDTILFGNKKYGHLKHYETWIEIYEYIKKLEI